MHLDTRRLIHAQQREVVEVRLHGAAVLDVDTRQGLPDAVETDTSGRTPVTSARWPRPYGLGWAGVFMV